MKALDAGAYGVIMHASNRGRISGYGMSLSSVTGVWAHSGGGIGGSGYAVETNDQTT